MIVGGTGVETIGGWDGWRRTVSARRCFMHTCLTAGLPNSSYEGLQRLMSAMGGKRTLELAERKSAQNLSRHPPKQSWKRQTQAAAAGSTKVRRRRSRTIMARIGSVAVNRQLSGNGPICSKPTGSSET